MEVESYDQILEVFVILFTTVHVRLCSSLSLHLHKLTFFNFLLFLYFDWNIL